MNLARITAPIVLLLVAALALGACGSSSDDGGTDAGASSQQSAQDTARVRLENCLREQGVELPEPGSGGGGAIRADDEFREAIEGPCAKYREQIAGDLSEEDRQELQDAMVKFASCMREHGVDMPDPQPGGGAALQGAFDPDDPKVQEASEACRDELPDAVGRRFGGGG